MKPLQEQAREWRRAFEVENDPIKGNLQFNLQSKLIVEEYTEVIDALCLFDQDDKETHSDLLKELADLVFVCYQAAENMSWDLDEAMHRVFVSNMSKLDEEGKPIRDRDGKILKSVNYVKPDLSDLV
jgi:predicted HAD superfamily Cof-like phosphohydrolase